MREPFHSLRNLNDEILRKSKGVLGLPPQVLDAERTETALVIEVHIGEWLAPNSVLR